MPRLPSGREFAISTQHFIDAGESWFQAPAGHFWYWSPAPEMAPAPYQLGEDVIRQPAHAPVPETLEDMQRYIQVVEIMDDGRYGWRGEYLGSFPQYEALTDEDQAAWQAWCGRPEFAEFLERTIVKCRRLAEENRTAQGFAVVPA